MRKKPRPFNDSRSIFSWHRRRGIATTDPAEQPRPLQLDITSLRWKGIFQTPSP